jgi:hypothetical protein
MEFVVKVDIQSKPKQDIIFMTRQKVKEQNS